MKIVLWIVSILLGLALLYFLVPGFFALFVNPKKNYDIRIGMEQEKKTQFGEI